MKKLLKDLRVIGVPWHVGHQFELAKLFKSYDLLLNHYRVWGPQSRPVPENMKMVINFNKDDYDLCILHVDQQCIDPKIRKGQLFREVRQLTKGLPTVIINHMTPFDDNFETSDVIDAMKALVEDLPMIVNSKQAAEQWGWGTPIIHGLTISDWWDLPKEPRIVTSLSTGGMNKAYRRELLQATIAILEEKGLKIDWIQADRKLGSWDEYRKFIGSALIYFHPAWMSPMPRSRTEAMLSGACIVSTRHQDWDSYIKDGENGFIIPDNPQAAARLLEDLITNRVKEARDVGQRGKLFAQKHFNHERWSADWSNFLEKVGIL